MIFQMTYYLTCFRSSANLSKRVRRGWEHSRNQMEQLPPGVGVTKPISSALVIFPVFQKVPKHCLPATYHIHIWQMLLLLRCVTPVKCECDSKNLTGTSIRSKIFLMKNLRNGSLVTPTPILFTWMDPSTNTQTMVSCTEMRGHLGSQLTVFNDIKEIVFHSAHITYHMSF